MMYLRSMTGFGQEISENFVVEIHSVNRKFLEIQLNIPQPFLKIEHALRSSVSSYIKRGQVVFTLAWRKGKHSLEISPNLSLVRQLKRGWDLIAQDLGISQPFSLDLLSQEKNLFSYEESLDEERIPELKACIFSALEKHQAMREMEGKAVAEDIAKRCDFLEKEIVIIESQGDNNFSSYRDKLKKRVLELLENDEERVLKEVALLAEKSDITEEIVRFKALLAEGRAYLESPFEKNNASKGKKLEFLLQELLRETNTIGSKSMDIAITKSVVTMKTELEKIREQILNIE